MNWNFYFDLCALIITVTLIFADFLKKTTKGRTNVLFISNLFVILAACICKIIYSLVLVHADYSSASRTAAYVFIYLYIIASKLVVPGSILYVFSSFGIWYAFRKYKAIKFTFYFFTFVPILVMLSNIFTKQFFFISGGMEYYENPAFVFNYITFCIMYLYQAAVVFLCRKEISRSKIVVALIILLINITLVTIQSFNSDVQLLLFVFSISAYLILMFTQRPELLVNPTVNAKAAHSFFEECKKSYTLRRNTRIIFLKILNHKNLNLFVGHDNYVMLLKKISADLTSKILYRRHDFDIYYLEDSLFALVTDSSNDEYVTECAQRINVFFSQRQTVSGFEISPELSVSVIKIPEDVGTFEYFEHFARNYHTMFGKTENPVIVNDIAWSKEFRMKNEIETILSKSFENNSLQIFLQPVWNVKKQKYTCAEALVRLIDDDFGFVSPAIFIPASEGNGLIYRIGEFVFEEVCRFISSDAFSSLGLEYIEVNLAKSQLVQTKLLEKISFILNKYSVSPEKIRFEITESTTDYNPVLAEANINALHSMGFRFALDDYGTGYSNITKVTNLPLKAIKLDKAFVDEIENPLMWSVIQDTVHMLKALKKEVIVEGVEDKKTSEIFEKLECDSIQGFYYSKPLPVIDFIKFLKANQTVQ